jgi:glycosyltransferase involved in cell wall biosynthesis
VRPLVIGIDARELLGARTGVGRYLGELLVRWTARQDAMARHFLLYAPNPLELALPGGSVDVRVVPGTPGTWWEQTRLSAAVRRDAPDVFFAPAYTAPVSLSAPLAVTIHDVSFSRHPEWFRPREGMRRRWLTRHAARRAGVVLTDSQFSAGEIRELYGIPSAHLKVIPVGVTSRAPRTAVAREPIVLFAGSLFNRRNLPDLLAAFARVVRVVPAARLVIIGDDRTWPPQPLASIAASHGIQSSVTFLRYVSDDELASWYARASAFAFLSSYEGFGLTPLEALSAGVPIVVADTPVAREVYGDAAAFVPLHDITATAAALIQLLTDRAGASAQLGRAAAILARYSWDTAADRTLDAIEQVARR